MKLPWMSVLPKTMNQSLVCEDTSCHSFPYSFYSFHSTDGDDKSAWKQLIGSVEQFDMPFEVLYQTSQRNLTGITSHTPFPTFLIALAARMETRLSLLSRISYTASYKAKKANADIMLEGESDWIMLIKDAEAFRANSRNKNKAWSIRIHDKSMTDSKESTGTKVQFTSKLYYHILTIYFRKRRPLIVLLKWNCPCR